MADVIQFPFVRNFYDTPTGLKNPVSVQDIQAANQTILTGLAALAGLGASDFAIFSGFVYSGGNYGAGVFFLDGNWYYQSASFAEGLRLVPNVSGTLNTVFPADGLAHDMYNIYYSQTGTGGTETPVFATGGDMSAYRMDNNTLFGNVYPTVCGNEQQTSLGSGYQVTFTKDKNVFFAAASSNATITFDMTNARPGVVVTLKWTFSGSETLALTAPGGATLIRESGTLALAANNTNILNIMYAGVNESGSKEIRYTFNQAQ